MTKINYFKKFKNNKEYQRYYREASDLLDIAVQVAEERQKKKITQVQLAKKTGMPQSQIARLESGSHNTTLATLYRVARALDLHIKITA